MDEGVQELQEERNSDMTDYAMYNFSCKENPALRDIVEKISFEEAKAWRPTEFTVHCADGCLCPAYWDVMTKEEKARLAFLTEWIFYNGGCFGYPYRLYMTNDGIKFYKEQK